jgi:hypothetical protein
VKSNVLSFLAVRVRWRAIVVLFLVCACESTASAHVTYSHTGPISLIYNADDGLCRPLVTSLNRTRHVHPDANYISEARSFVFKQARIDAPVWVRANETDLGNAFDDYAEGLDAQVDEFLRDGFGYVDALFFRADVAGDGVTRLVYLQNNSIGSHGDFGATLWVLKPGARFNWVSRWDPIGRETRRVVDPDIVDLKVDFADPRWIDQHYPNATVPDRTIFPESPVASADAQMLLLRNFRISQTVEQEPFVFNGKLYVLAGMPLIDSGLVYQITADMMVRVVCMTATRQTLDYVHAHPVPPF